MVVEPVQAQPKGRRRAADVAPAALDDGARIRLGLQSRSQENLRSHLTRAAIRFLVLVAGDVVAFAAMRWAVRAVRDYHYLGATIGRALQALVPQGALSGWQFAVALLVSLLVAGNYGQGDRRRDAGRLLIASALAVALPLWMEIWTRGLQPVAVEYVLTTGLIWLGICAERFTIDHVVAIVRPPQKTAARAIFVGPAEECRRAARRDVFASRQYYRALGFVDAASPPADDALGCRADLGRLIHEHSAETVVVCGHFDDEAFGSVVDTVLTAGCELISVSRSLDVAGVRPSFIWRDGDPLLALTAPALRGQQLFIKRVADVVFGVLGLVAASPLLLLIAIAVKLDSRGPILFRQERVGRGGRRFKILKFRTMDLDAEKRLEDVRNSSIYHDARLFKMVADPRVTRVGRWLRRTSLDELPQLWNVVRGQMSLVGPRPPLPSEVQLYQAHHYGRFDVKPGMTGPWQVSGRNEITDFEEVVRREVTYMREWNLWSDLAILLKTIPVVLHRNGAY